MKKTLFLCAAAAAFIGLFPMTSCDKPEVNEDPNETTEYNESDLDGQWVGTINMGEEAKLLMDVDTGNKTIVVGMMSDSYAQMLEGMIDPETDFVAMTNIAISDIDMTAGSIKATDALTGEIIDVPFTFLENGNISVTYMEMVIECSPVTGMNIIDPSTLVPPTPSIDPSMLDGQWVGTTVMMEEETRILFDIDMESNTITVGMMSASYEQMLGMYGIDFNPDTDFYPMTDIGIIDIDMETGIIKANDYFSGGEIEVPFSISENGSITVNYSGMEITCSPATGMNIIDLGM